MGTPSGRTGAPLAEQLERAPHRFEFFQAVRLLEHLRRELVADGAQPDLVPLGQDGPPAREVARFRVLPAQSFPACEITALRYREPAAASTAAPVDVEIAFLGLIGPSGALPQHYNQLVIDRVRNRDHALRDFLDLFHHRLASLFYRAWAKYRLPIAFERSRLDPELQQIDPFTDALHCLVGLGTGHLRGRLEIPDEAFLYYAGHFAHRPRSAAALESMLADYFQVPARALQFQGQWLYLPLPERSAMPSAAQPRGRNCRLGRNVVVGQRVWSIENRFRIRLGPVSYAEFRRFMPTGDALVPICQFVRSYVGPEYDFDIQPVLRADQTPACRLGGSPDSASFLGWNTWLQSRPRTADADDAVFQHEGFPLESSPWPI